MILSIEFLAAIFFSNCFAPDRILIDDIYLLFVFLFSHRDWLRINWMNFILKLFQVEFVLEYFWNESKKLKADLVRTTNQSQFSKHRPISNKISTNSKIFSLIRWNFRWFVEIFVENSLKFCKINESFIRWFVEFVSLISLIRWIRWKNQRK